MRYAIILGNMGAPASLDDVRPFLFNLFNDRRMIHLPLPLRWVLAFMISRFRANKSRNMYALLGGTSPLLTATIRQANALEIKLNGLNDGNEYKCFIHMRYTEPSVESVMPDIKAYAPDKLVILPLYPQMSTSTTLSTFDAWEMVKIAQIKITHFYDEPLFIRAHCRLIRQAYEFASTRRKVRVIFSAHSIPLSFIAKGDPYEAQIRESVRAIVNELQIEDHLLSYQSKVGLNKWLGPSTEEVIKESSKAGYFIILVPISFVSDNLEVNYEMDILYKKLAIKNGAKGCFRVQTLGSDDMFMDALARVVRSAINQ